MDLYEFQKAGLKRLEHTKQCAFFWDMGTGKSYIGLAKIKELKNKFNIIICQKSKIDDWKNLAIDERYRNVFDLTNKKEYTIFCNALKDSISRQNILARPMFVGVINYELFWRRKELQECLLWYERKCRNYTMLLDESSEIQNEKCKQSKAILKLAPNNIVLLSGTPVSGKYENLWSQLYLLGCKYTAWQFRQHFVNYEDLYIGNRQVVKVVSKKRPYRHVEELKRLLAQLNCDFLKTDEVLELPEQRDIIISCNTPKEFEKFIKEGIADVKDFFIKQKRQLTADNTLVKRLRAKQICSVYNENRFDKFKDLVNSTQDRLIVFYNFTDELQRLQRYAGNRLFSFVNGQTKDLKNYEEQPNSVTFVQYQAGAMGLNLQKANKCVFFSLTDDCGLYEQARKRVHRIGQSNKCTYYIFQAKNSIDERIFACLQKKMDYTNDLFIKDSLEWNKKHGK